MLHLETYVAGRAGAGQGAPARMPTRITVRYLGSEVGKKVARPDTKGREHRLTPAQVFEKFVLSFRLRKRPGTPEMSKRLWRASAGR